VILTYKHRLYATPEQEAVMSEILWVGCWLYNRGLAYRRKRWRESRHCVNYYEQAGMWRDWRNEQPADNLLRMLNMSAGQQVLRRLDTAYREFLKGRRGKPRFKRSERFNSVNFKPGDGANLSGRRLYLQNVGLVGVRWHRQLPDEGQLKNIILLRKPSGWYVLLQIELPEPEPEVHEGPAVGIDVGIHHALALSDGTFIDSPRYLEQSLRKLRVLQRTVARRKQGSRRWWQAVQQVRRQQEHIANQRRDWWHKVTRWLVEHYGIIALENLHLNFMLRNGSLARAAHDVSLGTFRDLLSYKAVRAGVEVVTVDPQHTSQVCHECGRIVAKRLSERIHFCPHCGYTVDRDLNAALNILHRSGRDRQAPTWAVGSSVA
jgi:putative transposase